MARRFSGGALVGFLVGFVSVALGGACGTSPTPTSPVDAGHDAHRPDVATAPSSPARICKVPSPGPAAFPWFSEVTAEVGLAKTASLEPVAGSVIAADLDGDGFADLVTTAASSARGMPTSGALMGKQVRFVFLSRPDPKNPKNRIFVDSTDASGLLATRDGKGGRGWGITNAGDLDDDGDVDLILCPADEITATYAPSDPCDAFLNDGHAHFQLASQSDLDSKVHWTPSGALLDFDRDGFLDFWPANVAHWPYDPYGPNKQRPTLYRGNGDGTFQDVSEAVGIATSDGTLAAGTQWRHVFGVVACDIDGDGDDDMIFADYGREENQVWRNDGGHFTNVAHELGIDHDDRTDYTDDQTFRCYCANTVDPKSCTPEPPAPIVDCCGFCAQRGQTCPTLQCPADFRGWQPGVTDQPYSLGGNYFSFACADMNDDGFMDLMSATIQHGDVGSDEDPSELILNPGAAGGPFTRPGNQSDGLYIPEAPYRGLYWNHGDDMMVLTDVDLDGRKDIFATTTGVYEASDTHRLWRQTSSSPTPRFEEIEYPAGLLGNGDLPNLQGPAFIDIDGDGDLDLVVGETTSPQTLHVFRNLVGQDQNWLRVRLVGGGQGKANTSAIGATVKVTAGGKTQTQYVSGGYGHGNVQADLVLTFGLGATCDIDEVEVRWPNANATVASYAGVLANYEVTIREGAAKVEYPKAPK